MGEISENNVKLQQIKSVLVDNLEKGRFAHCHNSVKLETDFIFMRTFSNKKRCGV